MVKSVLSANHKGLRDWMIQRVSAILMIIYTIGLCIYFLTHPALSFSQWHQLFSLSWVKIFSVLFLLSLLFHAFLGVWTIFTDYIKSFVLRCFLHTFVLLMLMACFIWGLMILWSV